MKKILGNPKMCWLTANRVGGDRAGEEKVYRGAQQFLRHATTVDIDARHLLHVKIISVTESCLTDWSAFVTKNEYQGVYETHYIWVTDTLIQ